MKKPSPTELNSTPKKRDEAERSATQGASTDGLKPRREDNAATRLADQGTRKKHRIAWIFADSSNRVTPCPRRRCRDARSAPLEGNGSRVAARKRVAARPRTSAMLNSPPPGGD